MTSACTLPEYILRSKPLDVTKTSWTDLRVLVSSMKVAIPLDFVDVASRQYLERNARPGIKARSALQGSPILAVAERTITHKPEVEQGEEVYQLEQRLTFATSVIVVTANKTAGFKVVKNGKYILFHIRVPYCFDGTKLIKKYRYWLKRTRKTANNYVFL